MEKKLSVIDELIENITYENKNIIRIQIHKDALNELKEKHKQEIIEAYRKGREAGAIFKSQKDSEGLAEQYFNNTFNQLNK